MSKSVSLAALGRAAVGAFCAGDGAGPKEAPRNYGIGHVATPEQIAGWDIDIRPDGQGASTRPRLGEGRRKSLHGQMRRLPRRVWRKCRALAAACAGQGHARLA